MPETNLTERQAKWFATVRAGLERETGKTLGEWVAIARACPEPGHRARLKWFKDNHGLLQNRASHVLSEAFGATATWSNPAGLIDALWIDAGLRTIFEAVDAKARALPDTIQTARKGYTAWSRRVQYAALKPIKGGGALLGLAVAADLDARLEAAKNDGWSERLTARTRLVRPADVDAGLIDLLRAAWARS